MQSLSHEALLLLFQKRPLLASELLRDALGAELPVHAEARFEACDLTREHQVDLVLLLADGRPTLAIVVEIMLRKEDRNLDAWRMRVAGASKRFGCPACLLVVAWSDEVADFARSRVTARKRAALAHVVGPSAVPVVGDVELARRNPELSVLSALAHVRSKAGLDVALAALDACRTLPDERARLYMHLISLSLDAIARTAFVERRPDARQATRELVLRWAKIKGREEGLRIGLVEGRAEAIPSILEARGMPLDPVLLERVLACKDAEMLGRWVRKAATITKADELFID